LNPTATAINGTTSVGISVGEGTAGKIAEITEIITTGAGNVAPADRMHRCYGGYSDTTAGSGTTPTITAWGQPQTASALTAIVAASVALTVLDTAYPIIYGFNQRGGMRFSVPQGEGLTIAGGATKNRFVTQIISDAAGNVDQMMAWWEKNN